MTGVALEAPETTEHVAPVAALSTRAYGYRDLAWVNDQAWFAALLPAETLVGARGVLDLGCGPARLAPWLRQRSRVPYVGVERNPTMLRQARDVEILRAEIMPGDIETFAWPHFHGWIFVVANVLHYLRDPGSLRSLPSRFGRPRRICLAQTESADEQTLEWARRLFAIVRPGYDRRWHKAGDLDDLIERIEAEVVLDRVVLQRVDLEAWLDGWQAGSRTRERARAHFDRADAPVGAPGPGRAMIRRQRILHLRF